ncbi:MAG: HD domain-containing protein [archaeon]|nr:HD domain-containing protein [archaeon]
MESLISGYVEKALSQKPETFAHTKRVVNYCKIIAKTEEADMNILITAAWLHDICWSGLDITSKNIEAHPQKSAELARKILTKINISDRIIQKIISAIANHELRQENPEIEQKILFEADHLDRIGAIGISRLFSSWGITDSLKTINTKILPDMHSWFSTKKGIEFAKGKMEFLNLFVDNYNTETLNSARGWQ